MLVAAAVLFVSVSPVMAVIEFNGGLTHDIDYEINDDVWVDCLSPGMGTTLNMLEGGSIPFDYRLEGFEDSIINVLGGSIYTLLIANDSTQVTVSGGVVGERPSRSGLFAYDSSQVTVTGGEIDQLDASGTSQVAVSGGVIEDIHPSFSSQVTVTGGAIGRLDAWGSSQATVSGGAIEKIYARDAGRVAVTGGIVDHYVVSGNSQITISGGLLTEYFRLQDNAVLTMDGSDFAVDGTPVGYIELATILGGWFLDEPHRRLTGTLLNGDSLDSDFQIGHSAKIILVPEPATILLLGFGGLALVRGRRGG